ANPSNATSASFAFTSSEEGSTFQCFLDVGAFVPCSSPQTYASLSGGPHTFSVEATDRAGNLGVPASRSWTVDTLAPATTITPASLPANPSNSTAPSFAFTASETGSSFQCSLDGATFAACTSPQTYTNLADGTHSFRVEATDRASNLGVP